MVEKLLELMLMLTANRRHTDPPEGLNLLCDVLQELLGLLWRNTGRSRKTGDMWRTLGSAGVAGLQPLTALLTLPWTSPSANSWALKLRLKRIRSSQVRPALRAWYFSTRDQRECSRTSRRTSLGGGGGVRSHPRQ